jgi:putative membrane protein
MGLVWGFVLSIVAALAASKLVSGVQIKTITAAVVVSVVVAVGGFILQKGLMMFLFPFNWLTLGLLSLVIGVVAKAVIVKLMDKKVNGFEVDSFGSAVMYCVVVSVIQLMLGWIF